MAARASSAKVGIGKVIIDALESKFSSLSLLRSMFILTHVPRQGALY